MKALIFSEGNGYGHVARDKIIADHFGFRIVTFGKGAEYCRMRGMDFIEIPSPYRIERRKRGIQIGVGVSELEGFANRKAMATVSRLFKETDRVIIDGSPFGLALAAIAGKRSILITNDISAMVGLSNNIQKRLASRLLDEIMKHTEAVVVPDFQPPMTVTALNLQSEIPVKFIGPLIERPKQKGHRKKYVVSTLDDNIVRTAKKVLGDDAIYGSDSGDIRPYYRDCKAVICHGGHTAIMDSLSYGKPPLCIVNTTYSERMNHATMLERLNVGVKLDDARLSESSLRCALDYIDTLDQKRLSLYKRTAEKMNALSELEKILNAASY